MSNNASTIAKSNAHYTCIECGATELISAHHKVPGDDSTLVCLCAECHSKKHPDVPKLLFFCGRVQPYWSNKSASTLAKANGVHPRTIIRIAHRLNIPKGTLTANDEKRILNAMNATWSNISIIKLAGQIGIHNSTIIRRAKAYGIPFNQSISQEHIDLLKLSPSDLRNINKPPPHLVATLRIRIWRCTACNHQWAGRKGRRPSACPKCKKYLYIEEVMW